MMVHPRALGVPPEFPVSHAHTPALGRGVGVGAKGSATCLGGAWPLASDSNRRVESGGRRIGDNAVVRSEDLIGVAGGRWRHLRHEWEGLGRPVLSAGSSKQPVAHPLLAELRAEEAHLHRLLGRRAAGRPKGSEVAAHDPGSAGIRRIK